MSNHQMLDNISHKNTRIKTGHSAALGDNVSAVGVFPSEFSQLQLEYPIFFKKHGDTGEFEAIALLGVDADENLFLTSSGWDGDYIPLSIARQPFLIGFQQTMENGVPKQDPVVTIDITHPRVNESEGEAIFNASGGNSDYLNHINAVLATIHEGHQQRQQLLQVLLKLELIESFQLSLTFNDGTAQTLEGLYTINEDRLKALPGEAVAELHRLGYLQHIYMMLASIGNIRRLIKRKEQQKAAF